MSASDYTYLKKSKIIKNYAPILSSGNKAVANYDDYVRKLTINTALNISSKDVYGDEEEKTINGIIINCKDFQPNTFDGVLNVVPMALVPTNHIGLNWRAYDGSMINISTLVAPATYTLVPNFFSNAGPKVGAQGKSSGISTSISDLTVGTNGNFVSLYNNSTNAYVIEWTGYFLCTKSGNWTFNLSTLGMDFSFFWLGPTAESGYNFSNTFIQHVYNHDAEDQTVDVNSNTMLLEINNFYKIRLQYSQPSSFQYLSLSFTDPTGNTTTNGVQNYFRENLFYLNAASNPLKSTPSVPAKLQQSCYRGEQPCTTFIHAKRAYHISNVHRRQWNQKKKEMLQITDSTTYKM